MKYFTTHAFILLTFFTSNLFAQDNYIPVNQTPEQIKTYVKNHFPATIISSVKKEKELLNNELEVKLSDSTKLTFNKNNALIEIESNKAIPEKILADTIYDIAHKNYPNNKIVGWEKTKLGQKVELDNDVELYFDDNGNFIRTEH